MSNTNISIDINVRASGYFIAQTSIDCRRCSRPTLVHAVGLPAGHEVLELDDDAADDDAPDDDAPDDDAPDDDAPGAAAPGRAGCGDLWQVAVYAALLFHVAYLSANVRRRLMTKFRAHGVDNAAPDTELGWVNCCEHCGLQFDDQELFCEPGAAFVPASDADAARIQLFVVGESIEAHASGYAYRPEFFDAMSRG